MDGLVVFRFPCKCISNYDVATDSTIKARNGFHMGYLATFGKLFTNGSCTLYRRQLHENVHTTFHGIFMSTNYKEQSFIR